MYKKVFINIILLSLIVLLTFIPEIGYLNLYNNTISIIHIPVLIGALLYKESGVILGTVYGLSTLLLVIINPLGPVDLIIQNPLVSIFPKVLFGVSIFYIDNFIKTINNNYLISTGLTIIVSSLLHSSLFLVMFYTFGRIALELDGGFFRFITSTLNIQIIEAFLALFIGLPIIKWQYAIINRYR